MEVHMHGLREQRETRLQHISKIENEISAPVLVYFTADAPVVGGRIGEDAPRTMYDHLRLIGRQKRLALYLYSQGGVMETPWKIVTMLREFCDELFVLVPYKAYSAATMIAIGADKIYMTNKGELGPIDPSLEAPLPVDREGPRLAELGVEDISSYLTFVRERAKLTDQDALAKVVDTLAGYLTPPLLGRIERISSHIRLVARNLLALHKPPLDDRQISAIAEALIEKIYVHGHGIGRIEAAQIGLDVARADGSVGDAMWALYEMYEEPFRLRESRDVEGYFPSGSDLYERDNTAVACIESAKQLDAFVGKVRAQRIRRIPPQPVININFSINIPPNIQAQQLPQAVSNAIQQLLQNAAQQLQTIVTQELARQSPVIGVAASLVGGRWTKLA
jgi:hypothetical protein